MQNVSRIRRSHPKLGCRKLKVMLEDRKIYIGRDRLFALLKKHNLLIYRRKGYVRTTNSRHRLKTYKNTLKDLEVTEPNQAWVSDITYIKTSSGFLYLSLISDAYSRKIVGYNVDEYLWASGSVKALKKAISELKPGQSPLHHSDRGIQYCSRSYIEHLTRRGMSISMTEENHCYENAMAERLNGILKHEYHLKETFRCKKQVRKACEQAINLYNNERPHMKLNMRTPQMVHGGIDVCSEKKISEPTTH